MTEGGNVVDPNTAHVPAQGEGQEQQPDWKEQLKSTIFRMVFFWMVMNWMKGRSRTIDK